MKLKIGDKVTNQNHDGIFIIYNIFRKVGIAYCRHGSGTTHTFGTRWLKKVEE